MLPTTTQPSRIHHPQPHSTHSCAFTLTELLIVIAIIVGIIGLTFPTMRMMSSSNKARAGIDTIQIAVTAARAFAGRNVSRMNTKFLGIGDPPNQNDSGRYSGVAIIFTPANELRVVENIAYARDGSGNLLELNGPPTNPANPERSGYVDIPGIDYITMPQGSGAVAIARNASGPAGLILLAPPFAVRFNEQGNLIAGRGENRAVFYDANYDDEWTVSDYRPLSYNPDVWNPDFAIDFPVPQEPFTSRYLLPFHWIETVIGVLVYSVEDFRNAGHTLVSSSNPSSPIDDPARDWLLAVDSNGKLINAQAIFFNRYTGAIIDKGNIAQ